MTAHVVTTTRRNAKDHLRLAWDAYEGHPFLDIRIFYEDGSDLKPSRKGVTIRPDRLAEFMQAIDQAEQVGRALGLIGTRAPDGQA